MWKITEADPNIIICLIRGWISRVTLVAFSCTDCNMIRSLQMFLMEVKQQILQDGGQIRQQSLPWFHNEMSNDNNNNTFIYIEPLETRLQGAVQQEKYNRIKTSRYRQ